MKPAQRTRRLLSTPLMIAMLLAAHPVKSGVVLLYHHVDHDTPPITSIAPDQFERHLEILEQDGFTILPLAELEQRSRQQMSTEKLAAITFDDAYISIYETAYPKLKARGWPFTIFVATGYVENGNPLYLTWAQLREMYENGASIENHTHSHAHLIRRQPTETPDNWRDRVSSEIVRAQRELTGRGFNPTAFAYPYGEYNAAILEIVAELGLRGYGQQSGAIGPYSHPLLLPRFPLAGIYAGETALIDKIRSLPMPVTFPDIEPLVEDDLRPALTLNFVSRRMDASGNNDVEDAIDDDLDPARLTCYGPGGLLVRTRQTASRIVVTPTEDIGIGRSRYNCTLPADGRYYWFSQLWIRKRPDGSWYPEP